MTPAPRRKRRLLVAAICVAGLASVFGLAKALHLFSGDGDSQPLILRLIEIKPQGERPSLPQDAHRVAAKQARAQARFVSTLDDQSQLDRLGPGSREALDEWMTACTLVPQGAWAMLVIAICQGQASVAEYMVELSKCRKATCRALALSRISTSAKRESRLEVDLANQLSAGGCSDYLGFLASTSDQLGQAAGQLERRGDQQALHLFKMTTIAYTSARRTPIELGLACSPGEGAASQPI